jgi:acyl-[acyl-carrier-protein] desaturase
MNRLEVCAAAEETAAQLLERHLGRAKEWFPHQLVPWGQGRDFGFGCEGRAEADLPEGVRSALWVGLLTEDNLPHYFHAIAAAFPPDSVFSEWTRRWAAEEGRHAIVIRDWVTVTRSLDLVELERARMRQVQQGFQRGSRGATLADAMVYLALQELATRIAHWNTGRHLDPVGEVLMRRVAADENLHFLFYRDMASALLELDPSGVVSAIDRQVSGFSMPGDGIAGFARHASAIAEAGIYDVVVHLEQILVPVVLNHWRVETLTGLDAEAEAARDHLLDHVARVRRIAARMQSSGAVRASAGAAGPG